MIFSILIWGLWIFILILLCLFTGNTGAFILLEATVLLFIVSVFINLFRKNKIDINLSFNSGEEKNKTVNGILYIANNSFLPISCLYIKLLSKNNLTGEEAYIIEKITLKPYKSKKIPVSIKSSYCGNITFSVYDIKLYDFLLLFKKRIKTNVLGNVLVYPQFIPVDISLNNIISSDDMIGNNYGSKSGFYTGDNFEIDEYNYGDSLKNIHWKLTSKFDRLMVTKQLKEVDNNILLLLETSLNSKQPINVLERLAEGFISLSYSLIGVGIRHSIGWYNHIDNKFYLYEINSTESLIALLSKILSVRFIIDEKNIFDYYNENYFDYNYSHAFYLSTKVCNNVLENLSITGLICAEESQIFEAKNVISFSPGEQNYISIKI